MEKVGKAHMVWFVLSFAIIITIILELKKTAFRKYVLCRSQRCGLLIYHSLPLCVGCRTKNLHPNDKNSRLQLNNVTDSHFC